jgi:hypothetical protein
MRSQKNIFERVYRPDSGKITITTTIDIQKPIIKYHIRRTRGKTVIYSYKGEKEIFL